MLGKRPNPYGDSHRHKKQESPESGDDYDESEDQEEDDEDRDLSDFVVDDDEEEDEGQYHRRHRAKEFNYKEELSSILKSFGPKRHYYEDSDDSSDSMMEANYDTIENEERLAAKIARREDADELKKIEEDEKRCKLERR